MRNDQDLTIEQIELIVGSAIAAQVKIEENFGEMSFKQRLQCVFIVMGCWNDIDHKFRGGLNAFEFRAKYESAVERCVMDYWPPSQNSVPEEGRT